MTPKMLTWMITYCIALPLRPILNFLTDLRIEAILEWARVILSSEILAVILSWCLIAEHVYSDNRSLGLLLCGTSGGLGGWGVRHLSGLVLAVWSALMISSAITRWKCGSEWSVYCHLFHCCLPFVGNTWPSVSSFLRSGQILVWHPRCSLEWLLTVSRFSHVTKVLCGWY